MTTNAKQGCDTYLLSRTIDKLSIIALALRNHDVELTENDLWGAAYVLDDIERTLRPK